MRRIFFVAGLIALSLQLTAQQALTDTVYSKVATKQAREQRYKYLVDTTIKQYLLDSLFDETEGEWNLAFWSLELLQYRDAFTTEKLAVAWSKASQLSEYFQKNLLEVTYSLYKKEFKTQALRLMQQTRSVGVFVRCAEYVLRADPVNGKAIVAAAMNRKFPGDPAVGLQILRGRITTKPQPLPPLKDILSSKFLRGQTVIYSLQRSSRDYAGLVIIRQPDGTFMKDIDGHYFHAAQLAKAITAYPFYITNGNTPQGILRFSGFDVSRLLYIGPTQNLQLQLPYETTPEAFFGDSTLEDTPWNKQMYVSLLPASWKNYDGIYESYYAGRMGRSAVIMHGTTIDPSYYQAQPYYPQTPSLGCLCSYEEWDESGFRVSSNQQKIVDALNSIDSSDGYVVVIDIDNKKKNVTIDEVKALLDNIDNNAK